MRTHTLCCLPPPVIHVAFSVCLVHYLLSHPAGLLVAQQIDARGIDMPCAQELAVYAVEGLCSGTPGCSMATLFMPVMTAASLSSDSASSYKTLT